MSMRRGFTLAEMIVGVVMMTIFLIVAYVALEPVVAYVGAAQAKTDTQGDAVALLFKLERDLHDSDANSVFYDNSGATALPTPPASPVSVTTFAVATADSGTNGSACYPPGPFQVNGQNGAPLWQGFKVFMRTGTQLNCVFENESMSAYCLGSSLPCAAGASAAITAAKAITTGIPFYGTGVLDLKIGASPGQNGAETGIIQYVNLQIEALSTVDGRTNATSYTDELQTRN
ncbi:MAG TPA: prepilin-type N-terminal cleavage/methylation domain-containing protein [Candidatus Eremiobacteraceae bacterium]|nr:prepilin-type N-terminal cleavage/methylation domain-containing protein [Candidatus Eremiobacteraceae bacterium]